MTPASALALALVLGTYVSTKPLGALSSIGPTTCKISKVDGKEKGGFQL